MARHAAAKQVAERTGGVCAVQYGLAESVDSPADVIRGLQWVGPTRIWPVTIPSHSRSPPHIGLACPWLGRASDRGIAPGFDRSGLRSGTPLRHQWSPWTAAASGTGPRARTPARRPPGQATRPRPSATVP